MNASSLSADSGPLPPDTVLGAVRLVAADVPRLTDFYQRVLGLTALESSNGVVRLGPEDGSPLVELVSDPDAPPRPPGTTGLFHLAILVPTRSDLAAALQRIVNEERSAFTGASDHLVSEALYLTDAEGNGIEIYRDRPREAWTYVDGDLQMATQPLDIDGVMHAFGGRNGIPGDTRIGHVHLQVANLSDSETFYHGLLGFDVVVRTYPGALFVSAGGYHHHVGLNTWAGPGAPAPPPGSRGLESFELFLPDRDELDRRVDRLRSGGVEVLADDAGAATRDPAGNGLRLRVAG
jgi:catechol 2,3-dioxygenase